MSNDKQVIIETRNLRITVEPLYKGRVGGESFVSCTVDPLCKGQVGVDLWDDLYRPMLLLALALVVDRSFVPCREVVLFSELGNSLFSEV